MKIMILDDDALVRKALSDVLSDRYAVTVTRNYAEFKSTINNDRPHILFLDLNLPDSYGIDICRSLRRSSRYDNIVIIILTGSNDPKIIEEGYAAGADDFIRKPFIPYEIKSKISIFERIIRGRKNLESAFKDQLLFNRKLYQLEEKIKKNLGIKSDEFSYQSIDMLHDIVSFGYYEAVRQSEVKFSTVAKSPDRESFISFSTLVSGGLLKEGIDSKGKKIKAMKAGRVIHIFVYQLFQTGRPWGYVIIESESPFQDDDIKIISLYLDYLSIMSERFIIDRILKNKNREYKSEISKIRKIQVSTLPDFSNMSGYDIAASYLPAAELSGDFFDGFFIDDDIYQLILCDISGHGMASAYVGTQIRTIFRNASEKERSPAAVAGMVSEAMLGDLREMAYFGTVIICQIYMKEGRVLYLNGGHPAALYYSQERGVEELHQTGPLVGLFPDNEYTCRELLMNEGDTLFLYTDGIIEASPKKKEGNFEMYGEKRLINNFKKVQNMSSRNIIHSIIGSLYEFTDYTDQEDDITAICIRRNSAVGGIIMF